MNSEATVKVHVGGRRIIATAEGNGPVNALDSALRSAVAEQYPELNDVELVDYKVRILAGHAGTDSDHPGAGVQFDPGVREPQEWTTVGVHANVVEASWQALVDALVYVLPSPVGLTPVRSPDLHRAKGTAHATGPNCPSRRRGLRGRRRPRRQRAAGPGDRRPSVRVAGLHRQVVAAGRRPAARADPAVQDAGPGPELPGPRRRTGQSGADQPDDVPEAVDQRDRAGRGDQAARLARTGSTTRASWPW